MLPRPGRQAGVGCAIWAAIWASSDPKPGLQAGYLHPGQAPARRGHRRCSTGADWALHMHDGRWRLSSLDDLPSHDWRHASRHSTCTSSTYVVEDSVRWTGALLVRDGQACGASRAQPTVGFARRARTGMPKQGAVAGGSREPETPDAQGAANSKGTRWGRSGTHFVDTCTFFL